MPCSNLSGPYRNMVEATELPQIVQLERNLYGACFALMKQLPARFILDRARAAGLLQHGSAVIETSSGTFALALANVCALRGYHLTIVSDPVIDCSLRRRLEDLGTRVEVVSQPATTGGYQKARLDRMNEIRTELSDAFWPCQYDNPHNPGAYAPCAELLAETLGRIDCLVGTVGSGGSTCGTSHYLRALFPSLQLVGVDTYGSVLFGQSDGKRHLRGLGNSVMPKNLDHSHFDEVHWVGASEAFCATRQLHRIHALYMGGTSGAAYLVARWWAREHCDQTVVVLFPDQGYRYQSTIYNDQWLSEQGLLLSGVPEEPSLVSHPREEAGVQWTRIQWNRRALDEVAGSRPGHPT